MLEVGSSKEAIKLPKTKHVKLGDGLDKLFKERATYSSSAHKAKGSTWLKEPPKYGTQKAGGKRRKRR
jgi:hypothetical protein